MKTKAIFNYIKSNPLCRINQIAKVVNCSELEALNCVNNLHKKGYIKITPIPLTPDNDDSTRYSAIKNSYDET